MELTVRLFATLKAQAGAGEVTVEVPEGAQVADLLRALSTAYPALAAALPAALVAVNREYADLSQPLRSDDEIALFPPVSGG